jgi:hypothetical protein
MCVAINKLTAKFDASVSEGVSLRAREKNNPVKVPLKRFREKPRHVNLSLARARIGCGRGGWVRMRDVAVGSE